MLERISKNPLLLAAAFLVSAMVGAGVYAVIQSSVPAMGGDKARIEKIVHDYILANGELLPEAMNRLEQKRIAERDKTFAEAPKYIAANRSQIAEPFAGAVQGNPRGDVTVSAFLDYNCGYCRASLPAIAELLRRDPNVRIVYREFPVLAPSSTKAAQWALAAAEQGKFMAFHHALYDGGQVSDESILAAVTRAGMDRAVAEKAAGSARIEQEIKKNHKLAEDLGSASATPFWVIGNKVEAGMMDYDRLAAAVAAARKGK